MRRNVGVKKEMELEEIKLEEIESIVGGGPGDSQVHCVSHFNNFIESILWIVIK